MKTYACEQRSPEWRRLRAGKLCASDAAALFANGKSGLEAVGRRDLRLQIVCERLTGEPQDSSFVNAAMEHGIVTEPRARLAYEALTGSLVSEVGFCVHDTLALGCSPDGFIEDGRIGVEIKCPKTSTHLTTYRAGTVPKEYLPQIVHSLLVTGAEAWDFVSFDDRLPKPLQLVHIRVPRNETDLAAYEILARAFLKECDAEVDALTALGATA